MPPSPTLIARDARTGPRTALAGHRPGRWLLDLALAEEVDPADVRRVLRAVGIEPGPTRPSDLCGRRVRREDRTLNCGSVALGPLLL